MKQLLFLIAVCFFLTSCQREIEELTDSPNTSTPACKMVTSYTYNLTGSIGDSAVYVYKGDKVVRITQNSIADSVVLQYTGTILTRRTYYNGGVVNMYDELTYGANGNLTAIKQMADLSFFGGNGFACVDSLLFQWSGSKLVTHTRYSIDINGPGLVETEQTAFEYSGGNITKSISRRSSGDTTVIAYDSQPNFLKKQGFPHLVADIAFMNVGIIADYFALFLSENNPVRVWDSQQPADVQLVEYTKDQKGNVTLIKSGGDPILGYRYQCP